MIPLFCYYGYSETLMLSTHCYDRSAFLMEGSNGGNKLVSAKTHACNSKVNSRSGVVPPRGTSLVFTSFFHDMPFGRNRWSLAIIQGLLQRTKSTFHMIILHRHNAHQYMTPTRTSTKTVIIYNDSLYYNTTQIIYNQSNIIYPSVIMKAF
jgi:hypothetical protein